VVIFQFVWKVHLSLPSFLAIQWPVPLILEKLISLPNFIFIFFQSFMGGRRKRGSSNSGIEREKYRCDDFNHQNSRFLFQMISYDEKSLNYMFFFFILKVFKKTYLSSRRFLILDFKVVFCVFGGYEMI
jgi:hypothetical protein